MSAADLRGMTDEQLALAVNNTTEELFKLRFQHHTGQLQNTANLRLTRKKLAQVKTVIAERKHGLTPGSN